MEIEVLLFGKPRELAGTSQETVTVEDGAVLKDLVKQLGSQHGAAFAREVRRTKGIRILINGREYGLLGGMEAPLSDKDTVVFLPMMFGG